MQTFKHTVFFNLLLPPIILNSGYELKQVSTSITTPFFLFIFAPRKTFSGISGPLSSLLFSAPSFLLSELGKSLKVWDSISYCCQNRILVYIYSFLGIESLDITLLECLIFGSTLSATDPVTILAIFNQYKVDPKLYTIIFGESLLNDAVSIVMYE